jgi:aminopeptidase N
MANHFLTDKSLSLEAAFFGFAFDGAPSFAEPGVQPHYAPDLGFRLNHLGLSLTIDPTEGTLKGEAKLEIQPLPVGMGEVVLDFDDLILDSIENGAGEALDHSEADGKLTIDGVNPSGETITIRWHGKPTRGMYFTGPSVAEPNRQQMAWSQCQDEDAHFFFPCVDHPSVKCGWSLEFTVPKGMQAIGNGKFVGKKGNTWKWEQAQPMPSYLFTVCVGNFDIYTDANSKIPVRYLAPAGVSDEDFARIFGKTPRMIEFYEERFGHPYPWPRYDQIVVHDFIFGGMENVAATTLTDLVLTDERAAIDWDAEDLIAHELAHQWFGDLLTCQDWSQGYLNEAWATYSEVLWKTHDLGIDEAMYHLYGDLKNYLSECASRYKRPIVSYQFKEPIDMFDRHLYEKGALVVHTLRTELGEEAFWEGVKHYLHDNAHTTVHTRDFQVALEQASGRNLDGFFQDWILSPGHPALTVKTAWAKGLLKVTVIQRQKGTGTPEAYRFGLSLLVVSKNGENRVTLPVSERSRTWAIPMDQEPQRVEIDHGFRFLSNMTVEGSRKLLIASLKGDSCVVGRIRAAKALAKDGSPKAVDALASALKNDAFWGVRTEIARLLGKHGTDAARLALLTATKDEHSKARAAVVDALGTVPSHPDVIEVLSQIAKKGDPSLQVEGSAIRSLCRLKAPGCIELALEVAERPCWGAVFPCRMLEGLALTRDPAVIQHLLDWTGPEKPERARCTAAASLGRMAKDVESVQTVAVDRLIELVQTGSFRLKYTAVSALGSAGAPAGIPVLRSIHEGQSDGRVRRSAYEAIQRINKNNKAGGSTGQLRRDLDQLRDENKKLRSRVDVLEQMDAPS